MELLSYAGLEPCQVVPDAVFEPVVRVGRPVYRLSYLDRPWPVSTIRHPPKKSAKNARLAGPIYPESVREARRPVSSIRRLAAMIHGIHKHDRFEQSTEFIESAVLMM